MYISLLVYKYWIVVLSVFQESNDMQMDTNQSVNTSEVNKGSSIILNVF